MEEITISKNPPREKGTFERIRVSKGIEKNYIIAAGLMFLGVIVIVAMFLPPCELGLTIFQGMMTGVLIAVGAIIVGITNMKVKSRKKALCNVANVISLLQSNTLHLMEMEMRWQLLNQAKKIFSSYFL
jgi:hypothetical protein